MTVFLFHWEVIYGHQTWKVYRHFKGNFYEVIGVARHSETMEEMVVYRALYGEGGLWVRPAAMWTETVDRDGYHGPRFQFVDE